MRMQSFVTFLPAILFLGSGLIFFWAGPRFGRKIAQTEDSENTRTALRITGVMLIISSLFQFVLSAL